MNLAETIAVKYIGRRESFTDTNYRSGLTFNRGQTRSLPVALARQFLRHADLFEVGTAEKRSARAKEDDTQEILESVKAAQKEEAQTEMLMQDLRDTVQTMDKDALAEFAQVHYQQQIDKRHSIESLREQVVQFIDRFGAL